MVGTPTHNLINPFGSLSLVEKFSRFWLASEFRKHEVTLLPSKANYSIEPDVIVGRKKVAKSLLWKDLPWQPLLATFWVSSYLNTGV